MPSNNKIIIATAGSGKTYDIVHQAYAENPEHRILITTYTLENVDNIKNMFYKEWGLIPPNIRIMSWFTFLLKQCVRPYQNMLVDKPRIKTIHFLSGILRGQRKEDYIDSKNRIYSNKLSEFAYDNNFQNNNIVLSRLEKVFDTIYIDEIQDIAGYDLELLEQLLKSSIHIHGVGDPKQSTFQTNYSAKNRQYLGENIINWFIKKETEGILEIEYKTTSRRNNSYITNFSNGIFENFPDSSSIMEEESEHDGIFCIVEKEVYDYYNSKKPVVLRHNKRTNTYGLPAINMGLSKGRTYERVMIIPTGPMREYLTTGDISKIGDKYKFYIAVTRAIYSVCFVFNNETDVQNFNQIWRDHHRC